MQDRIIAPSNVILAAGYVLGVATALPAHPAQRTRVCAGNLEKVQGQVAARTTGTGISTRERAPLRLPTCAHCAYMSGSDRTDAQRRNNS
jgi:hypothetical protein